jgi:S1-C subfamily serine protease
VLPLGNSDQVRVGDIVLAVGNPMGVGQTVTIGIISAKGRATGLGDGSFEDFLQTDAPINQGNSGGALVNARGEVIGINVAYIPPEARAVSIGFAIPAPTVRDDVRQLIADGKAEHAFLGVQPSQVTPEIAQEFGLSVSSGVLVDAVVPGSAAARSGIRPGDVIVALGGTRIRTVEDLFAALRRHRPGQRVRVTAWRNGSRVQFSVTLRGRALG